MEKFDQDEINKLARWFKLLGEPKRLLLLESIISGVQCNCEIGKSLGMAPNLISHHLSVLREAGIIETERAVGDSRWIYYSVNPQVMQQLQGIMATFFDRGRIQPRHMHCGPKANDD